MNDKDMIQALKETYAKFYDLPSECQDVLNRAGKDSCFILMDNGHWEDVKVSDGIFTRDNRYRLRPDYEPPFNSFELDVHSYYINDADFGNSKIHMAGNNHTIGEVEQHIGNLQRLVETAKGENK